MSLSMIALVVIALGAVAFFVARARANVFDAGDRSTRVAGDRPHSRPVYHGAFVALAAVLPALLLLGAFAFVEPKLLDATIISSLPAADQPKSQIDRDAIIGEVKGLASGDLADAFNPASKAAVAPYVANRDRLQTEALVAAVLIAFGGAAWAYTRLAPQFRARNRVERIVMGILIVASLIAVLTTFGIVFSLLFEIASFLQDGFAVRVPVRAAMVAADRDSRRPSRQLGRVRRRPAVLGDDLHWRDYRDGGRHSARADERHLADAIRTAETAQHPETGS